MVMHVGAGARAGRERLGHESGNRAGPPGQLTGHHPEDDQAIGGLQRFGVLEIDLVLEVSVLVVGLIDAPAEPVEAVVERAQEPQSARDALEVVARLGQIVDGVRVPAAQGAVALLDHQEEFRLDADVEDDTRARSAWARTRLRFTRGQ